MAKATSTKITSSGICKFCQGEFDKSKMTQHLKYCKQRASMLKTQIHIAEAEKTTLFHILVEGRYLPMYWMHLEIPANSTLYDLDAFLRNIWLECCGHLSEFHIGKRSYLSQTEEMMWEVEDTETDEDEEVPDITRLTPAELEKLSPFEFAMSLIELLQQESQSDLADLSPAEFQSKFTDFLTTRMGDSLTPEMLAQLSKMSYLIQPLLVDFAEENNEQDMDVELSQALKVGQKFFHEYDFGSTTELALKLVAEREGIVSNDDDDEEPVEIMARNNPPAIPCRECGKPATKVASGYYDVGDGALCDACARTSLKEYEDFFLPIVNSPRVGVCGYTGDSEGEEIDWDEEDDEEEFETEEDEEIE
jgi:hypothetical protein